MMPPRLLWLGCVFLAVAILCLALVAAARLATWLVTAARAEALIPAALQGREAFTCAGGGPMGDVLAVMYVTHRHRLCIDVGSDGWDAAVPPGTVRAWRGLHDAGVTVGMPCPLFPLLPSPSFGTTLRYSDVVALTMTHHETSPVIATAVPGAYKVLVLLVAVSATLPPSVDAALAQGMRVVVGTSDVVTARLVADVAWIAGWPTAQVLTEPIARHDDDDGEEGSPLVDALEAVAGLVPGAVGSSSRTLRCVALWISPLNEFAFSDAPQLRDRQLAVLAYDTCFDGPDGETARSRLRRRRPLADTVVVDTQQLLPERSARADKRRRLTTCIMSPVVLYSPSSAEAEAADRNPLAALLVRATAASNGERSAVRATLAQNSAIALYFPMLPRTAAWMADLSRTMSADLVQERGDGGSMASYSIYDTNGGPLEPSSIPRRAVLEQFAGADNPHHVHLASNASVPGYMLVVSPSQRKFAPDSPWIGGVRLRPGDHVELGNQVEARENGRYVVVTGDGVMVSAASGTYVPTRATAAGVDADVAQRLRPDPQAEVARRQVVAPAGTVRDPGPDLLDAGDAVWLSNVGVIGTWQGKGSSSSLLLVPSDVLAAVPASPAEPSPPWVPTDGGDRVLADKFTPLGRCVTDPTVTIRELCEAKAGGVWDRPCTSDADCPFFQTAASVRRRVYRGGCDDGGSGMCEMPLGVKQLSYRYYDAGAASRPMCYGCSEWEENADDTCCAKSAEPDYVFQDDRRDLGRTGA